MKLRRLLTLLLAFAVLTGLLLTGVAAASGSETPLASSVASVTVGGTTLYYDGLKEAVDAAPDGAVVTLLADDVSLQSGAEIVISGRSVTITGPVDADGKPLYTVYGQPANNGYNDIFITGGGGAVTISNLNITEFGNEASTGSGHAPIYVGGSFTGTVTFSNLSISKFNRSGIIISGGSFLVEGCVIDCSKSTEYGDVLTKGVEVLESSAAGTVRGTTVTGVTSTYEKWTTGGMEFYGSGDVAVTDCTVTGLTNGIATGYNASGAVTVSGCAVDVVGSAILSSGSGSGNTSAITVTGGSYTGSVEVSQGSVALTGGDYTGELLCTGGSLAVSGGSFSAAVPLEYCVEGFEPKENADGTYSVSEIDADWTAAAITIGSEGELRAFAAQVNGGRDFAGQTVALSGDVALTLPWTPIGVKDGNAFSGTFDGAGHTVSGLSIDAPSTGYQALFGRILNGTAQNLTVSGSVTAKDAAGIVARMDGGLVKDCVSSVTVAASSKAGGVVCLTTGSSVIEGCTNSGTVTVTGTNSAAGILGYANAGTVVTGCVNTAAITGENNVGGIIGIYKTAAGTAAGNGVFNCTNTGSVTDTHTDGTDRVGGIAAIVEGDGATAAVTIDGNTNEGAVSGYKYAAGIVGHAVSLTVVSGNVNSGEVTTRAAAGSGHVSFPAGIVSNLGAGCTATGNENSGALVSLQGGDTYFIVAENAGEASGNTQVVIDVAGIRASKADPAVGLIKLGAKIADPYVMALDEVLVLAKNGKSITVSAPEGLYVVKSSTANGVTTYTVVDALFEITKANGTVSYSDSFGLLNGNGSTVKLLMDFTTTSCPNCGSTMQKNANVILDLNGHTLHLNTTSTRDYCMVVTQKNTLTIRNGTIELAPTNENRSNGIRVESGCTLNIEDSVTVNAHNGVSAVTVLGASTLNTAGNLTAEDSFTIAGNGSSGSGGYTVNVTGGTVTATNAPAIYHPNEGTLTISGGTITGATAVYVKSGELSITGGTLKGTGASAGYTYNGSGANATGDALVIDSCGYPGGAPVVTISGGSFESDNAAGIGSYAGNEVTELAPVSVTDPGNITLPADERWSQKADGTWEIVHIVCVASVDGQGYETFAEAAAAAEGTKTIVLSADIAETYTLAAGETLLVNKNGYSLTVAAPEGYALNESTEDGVTTYTLTAYAAQMGGNYYFSFAEAAAARSSNDDVITLLAKAADAYTIPEAEVTAAGVGATLLKVAKNGFTVTVKVEGPYVIKSSAADGVTTYTAVDAAVKYTNASGNVTYSEALPSAFNDGTYQLLADVLRTARMVPGSFAKDVTLDLNGHTLTSTATDSSIYLNRAGSASSPQIFRIVNTAESGGTLTMTADIALRGNYNQLTIGEGVIVSGGSIVIAKSGNEKSVDCVLDVYGTVIAGDSFAITTNGSCTENATINIHEGAVVTAAEAPAIYMPSTGSLNISGGTITGTTAVYVKSGGLTITGGTLRGTGAKADYAYNGDGADATGDALVIDSCGYPGGAPAVTISGGSFVSDNAAGIGSYAGNEVTELAPVSVTDPGNITLPADERWSQKADETWEIIRVRTVTFVDEDGVTVLLAAAEYPYGTAAADIAKPADPAKAATAQYAYVFAGWSPALADVTEDAVYTAAYTETARTYGDPVWTWLEDETNGYTASAAFTTNDGMAEFTQTLNASVSSVRTEPKCETDGSVVYTAAVAFGGQTYTDTKTDTLTALGHSWGEASYTWSEDNSSVTATRSCARDASHVETETVTATSAVTDPTCEAAGKTVYTASFDNAAFVTQTKEVPIDALGHSWDEPVWTWSTDYTVAMAIFTCETCNRKQPVFATVEDVVIPATCEEDGKTAYTATAVLDGRTFNSVKEDPIPALGHSWGEASYTWSEDNSSVTATRSCTRDASHVETETVTVTSAVTDPTCEAAGKTVYTAKFDNAAFVTQTKEVPIDALGHSWDEPVWTWSGNNLNAVAMFTCGVCSSKVNVTADITVTTTEPSCSAAGETAYNAAAVLDGRTWTDKHTTEIPMLEHTPGEAKRENEVPATETAEGSYDEVVCCSVCRKELSRTHHTVEKLTPALEITDVTASKTNAEVNESIRWTATAAGGTGTYRYCFYIYLDGSVAMKGNYGAANSITYTPAQAGTWTVKAYVRDTAGTVAILDQAGSVRVTEKAADALTVTGVTVSKDSAAVGESITWTATAAGGTGAIRYCFYLYKDGEILKRGSYGAAGTYAYTPDEAGIYTVRAFAKDADGTVTYLDKAGKVTVTLAASAPSITEVSADQTTAEVGGKITWTAEGAGGTSPLKYCFYIFRDGTVVKRGSYGTAKTVTFTPDETGIYTVRVYVKDAAGLTVHLDKAAEVIVASAEPLAIDSVKASKTEAEPGDEITWTANASGGTGRLQYCFYVFRDGTVVKRGSYGTAKTFSYEADLPGTWTVRVYVKDAAGSTVTADKAGSVSVASAEPLTIDGVKANKNGAEPGEDITWTVTASGGTGRLQYCFYVFQDGRVVEKSVFGTGRTYTYTAAEAGTYTVRVYVKDATGTTVIENNAGSVRVAEPEPLAIESVKASKSAVVAGESITWTATAVGGTSPLKYCFYIFRDGAVMQKGAYGTGNTCTFTPDTAGIWTVRVYVKDASGTVVIENNAGSVLVSAG